MNDDIQRIDEMIKILRAVKADKKKQSKLSGVNSVELSPKQAQKRAADADWIAMAQIKRSHELHALAVELGFADYRGHDSYQEIEVTDGWHRYRFKPRKPFESQAFC